MAVEFLRTPEDRFQNLPGFDYQPHYLEGEGEFAGMRQHYVDEGPKDAAVTFLCLHGEPTWAYLYRKMIPIFTAAGHRVIAPDFYGFGRSDKPVVDSIYTFDFHRNSMLNLLRKLSLKNVCLVCQDWGGLIGLTLPMEFQQADFSRLLVMNTGIGTGKSPGKGFDEWKAFAAANPDLKVGQLLQRSHPAMSDEEAAAYDAPYPDVRYKGGVRRFPELVPVSPDMDGVTLGRTAANWWREEWQGESFMAIGMQDPVLGAPQMRALQQTIRNCPEPMEVEEGGHFVQECGAEIATAALDHFNLAGG